MKIFVKVLIITLLLSLVASLAMLILSTRKNLSTMLFHPGLNLTTGVETNSTKNMSSNSSNEKPSKPLSKDQSKQ